MLGCGQMPAKSVLEAQLESNGLAESFQSRKQPRNPLSQLAAQCIHTVRNVRPGEPLRGQDGHVQRTRQAADRVDTQPEDRTHPHMPDLTSDAAALQDEIVQPDWSGEEETIVAEAARVKAKFASIDAKTEVVLRFDFMNETDTKVASSAMFAATLLGLAVLVAEFTSKMKAGASSNRFRDNVVSVWNTAIGVVCLVLMTAILSVFAWRVTQARQQKKSWKTRRKRNPTLFFIEGTVQWLNLVFWVAPNIYLLVKPCYYVANVIFWCGWARRTCWNTSSGVHAVCLWAYFTSIMLLLELWILLMSDCWDSQGILYSIQIQPCLLGRDLPQCRADKTTKVAVNLMLVATILYFIATLSILVWKLKSFRSLPYAQIQVAVVFYRLQLRLRAIIMMFFGLCMILLWSVRINSCASYQFSWLGIMPMQLVATANAFVWTFIAMPHLPQDHAVAMRVWEQEVAWTEADKPTMVAARALTLPQDHKLNKTPIFCFETMMHMLYWSCLVYDYKRGTVQHQRRLSKQQTPPQVYDEASPQQQAPRTSLDLHTALGLYSLTDSDLFWELQWDTSCLLGWNHSTIVLAFRGTASVTNALSDIQAWRVAHPPVRGHALCGTRPLVHVGFMKAWLAGAFNEKVINHVMQLVNCPRSEAPSIKIYVTGHSLGGALATLAAYDIRQELAKQQQQGVEVVCYSYGAPRTGNHAFARDYNHMVPDTWSIINDQDVVTRGGKFLFLYKRPGKRVIVNDFGHFIVSPNSIEASIQQNTVGQSVDHHRLTNYHHAILSIILSQFSPKGLPGGMQGIIKLAQALPYLKVNLNYPHAAACMPVGVSYICFASSQLELIGRLSHLKGHVLRVQELLKTHMGMHVDHMQQFADMSPADRSSVSLPHAHLPKRGFYRIKALAASQLPKQSKSKPPSFRSLSCLGSAKTSSSSSALGQPEPESDTFSKASLDSVKERAEDMEGDDHKQAAPVRVPLNM